MIKVIHLYIELIVTLRYWTNRDWQVFGHVNNSTRQISQSNIAWRFIRRFESSIMVIFERWYLKIWDIWLRVLNPPDQQISPNNISDTSISLRQVKILDVIRWRTEIFDGLGCLAASHSHKLHSTLVNPDPSTILPNVFCVF
jgi:hypothetical protein